MKKWIATHALHARNDEGVCCRLAMTEMWGINDANAKLVNGKEEEKNKSKQKIFKYLAQVLLHAK